MTAERHVKLFKHGRNQAVRIPREFELPGEDAIMRKEGHRLIIEPASSRSLLAVLATLGPLDEGGNDLLIAAQVIALGHTIVTDNEREFARIDGIAWENWLRADMTR
jgi:antitoxin VapB